MDTLVQAKLSRDDRCVIRADGNAEIGTGHLMRCATLGTAWRKSGGSATLLSSGIGDALQRRFKEADINVVPIPRSHPDPSDLKVTLEKLKEASEGSDKQPWLILDGYNFDSDYQKKVKDAGYRLMVIDDTAHLSTYFADVLLNQNSYAQNISYFCSPNTVLLLGSRYALLRTEFMVWKEWVRKIPKLARKVLVTLGGGDNNSMIQRVIEALKHIEIEGIEAVALVGGYSQHLDKMHFLSESVSYPIKILHNVTNVAEIMSWADVAVSAGNTACWELAFMGLPSLLLTLADNQRGNVESLSELGISIGLGEGNKIEPRIIARSLANLMKDQTKRRVMSSMGRYLVDGKGVERVVQALAASIVSSDEKEFSFRLARPDDAMMLWQWANDPITRRNSFNKEFIPWTTHEQWFQSMLVSPDAQIWVFEWHGIPVGQIRYNKNGSDGAQISFSIVPAYRGRGFGSKILKDSISYVSKELGVSFFEGFVSVHNDVSKKAFIKAGFEEAVTKQISGNEYLVFRRNCMPNDALYIESRS